MLALLVSAGSAFVSPACSMVRHSSAVHAAPAAMMAKGFGKEPEKVAPKPASEGKKKRDAASAKLDKLKATGNPEYMVSIRTVGGETSEWMPVGGLAVPRSNSVDTAVSRPSSTPTLAQAPTLTLTLTLTQSPTLTLTSTLTSTLTQPQP